MTTSISQQSFCRVHNIVEYIRNNNEFLFDLNEIEERGMQNILQEDFDIYQKFTNKELQNLRDELYGFALENEIKEARHLLHKSSPYDEGIDLVHTNADNIYGRRTTHRVFYSYPVDKNLSGMKKVRYPLRRATQKDLRELAILKKLAWQSIRENHT